MNVYVGMHDAYPELCRRVLMSGDEIAPRGQLTRELRDEVFRLMNPYASLVHPASGRKLNETIAAVEAIQLIGGFTDADLNFGASSNFRRYVEPDGQFWAPYGRRITNQIMHVVRKLAKDRDSRQAVVTLWDPSRDNQHDKVDYPCTVAMTFSIRKNGLELSVYMRSNDLWLGTPYDVFQFTQLQITVANAMNLDVGMYTHHAVSLHLYERDWDKARAVKVMPIAGTLVEGFGIEGVRDDTEQWVNQGWYRWESAQLRARIIGRHEVAKITGPYTKSEQWYDGHIKTALDRLRNERDTSDN